ncbi:hypothetical protein AOL_s00007g383 [Orbilia oligospora ATCC 24927]|uniref:SRR1-like domain-containing protein n=1 Tax=Arthrobotrys oligospora (strain ATCC 24927 / CBS 115.81 / DSM 1491) TaxID=756982 RepID=G1X274_ARTOA|nr:hypothetical protein AOL_s00007g383 [Orbilia oligospora ATCC 24927]EGX53047.1 hypothetical protein AOL_s00007g383 [Orbilia oligospora ATCC 24927]
MSARQRHSRITTDDGWTTISNSNSRKSKTQNGKNNNNKKKGSGQKQNSIEKKNDNASSAAENTTERGKNNSALLAHKSDLDFHSKSEVVTDGKIDNAELEKVRTRVEKQIAGFMASECCGKVKEMVRGEFGVTTPPSVEGGGNEENGKKEGTIKKVLILALGSLSETFKAAPGYQLAAILSIIEVLKESYGCQNKSTDTEVPEKEEEKETTEKKEEHIDTDDTNLSILSYDPIYTPIDISILSSYNITTVSASSLPTTSINQDSWDKDWYEDAVVYMPHASVWLNHKYLMYKPKVWIGNTFEVYENAVSGGGEVDEMLKEAARVRKEEGYVKVEWPEEGWGGGAVFNNLVVYVRRGSTGVEVTG